MKQCTDLNDIYNATKRVFLSFSTPYCVPCKELHPHVLRLEKDHPEIEFLKVDATKSMDIARALRVMSVPTILLMENGQIVNRKTSPAHDSLEEFLTEEG